MSTVESPSVETTLANLRTTYTDIATRVIQGENLKPIVASVLQSALKQPTWDTLLLWKIYDLLVTPLSKHLTAVGIDPDMIPAPPARVIDLALRDTGLDNGESEKFNPQILLTLMNPDDATLLAVRSVTGITGTPASHLWRTSSHVDLIVAFLRSLVGKQYGFIVTDRAIAYLRTATPVVPTATKPSVGVMSLDSLGRPLVRLTKIDPAITDELHRISGLEWKPELMAFRAPKSHLREVATVAQRFDITLDVTASSALAVFSTPFAYDGTFNGLRGVPITDLACVDLTRAKRFTEFGIETVWDLINLIPLRYLDRSNPTRIRDLVADQDVGVLAKITNIYIDQRKRILKITLNDGSGKIDAVYFNALWVAKRFRVGDEVVAHGKVTSWTGSSGRAILSISSPTMDPLGEFTLPVIPIYPQSAKSRVTTWDIHTAVSETLDRLGDLTDSVPQNVRDNLDLMPRTDALRAVHLPTSLPEAERGRNRLAFDELFRMQLALLSLKAIESKDGLVHNPTGVLTNELLRRLPFELTDAQKRVVSQIRTGMMCPTSSRIMVQGDVGSGKSLVGIASMLSAIEGGYQAAMLAPTNLLATQLFLETKERIEGILLNGEPIRIEFFDNKLKGKRRKEVLADLSNGKINIAIGTHALLVPDIEFENLGFVVTDEQHKFGTLQRSILPETKGPIRIIDGIEKRVRPDSLLMSATPIPRSASLVFFGDLEMAIIDQLPEGRIPIKTEFINSEIDLVDPNATPWKEIRGEAEKGLQSYVICALVEDNEKLELASVKETFESLSNGALSELRVAMVYGQQDAEERKAIMDSYKQGEIDVLLGSTVLEVGISNPRSTIVVILDPSRYGLAQAHQLRGRVGRASFPSYCYLYGKAVSSDSRVRMQALLDSNDGFYLSDIDLSLRGHGQVFGESQSGASDLRVADLFLDKELITLAREAALEIIEDDPRLERRPGLKNEISNMLGEGAEGWLIKS